MIKLPWLIWSNEHRAWWGPNERGYTGSIEVAGRYPKRTADMIVRNANFGPVVNEMAVLAPEAVPMLADAIAQRERGQIVEIEL